MISLGDVGPLVPMAYLGQGERASAWVEFGRRGRAVLQGEPEQMRELAAVITTAADQADELLRVARLLVEAGTEDRPAA
jgi:hypothetical protein